MQEHKLSERAACRLAGIRRSSFRYEPVPRSDGELRARLKELAAKQSAYGYLMLHSLLKSEGLVVNKKRTYRIYTEEGLQVRTKKRKKLVRPRQPLELPVSVMAGAALPALEPHQAQCNCGDHRRSPASLAVLRVLKDRRRYTKSIL